MQLAWLPADLPAPFSSTQHEPYAPISSKDQVPPVFLLSCHPRIQGGFRYASEVLCRWTALLLSLGKPFPRRLRRHGGFAGRFG